MVSFFGILTCLAATLGAAHAAFVAPSSQHAAFTRSSFPSSSRTTSSTTTPATTYSNTKTAHSMLGGGLQAADAAMNMNMNSLVLATIDSDIANISTDQFGLVFAGGIAVMVGGVLSALIVGFILERGDLYASVVADSYLQGAQDEDFWKGLSDEEKNKAQELLNKIKAQKEGGSANTSAPQVVAADAAAPQVMAADATVPQVVTVVAEVVVESPQVSAVEEKKEVGMFSDYGADS